MSNEYNWEWMQGIVYHLLHQKDVDDEWLFSRFDGTLFLKDCFLQFTSARMMGGLV